MNRNLTILFLTLLIFISCKNQKNELYEVGFWKHYDGFRIGDVINFDTGHCKIQNDTIYKNEKPVAILIKIENRFFTGDKFLHIKDLTTDRKGIYIGK
jgi:hypothetical protein